MVSAPQFNAAEAERAFDQWGCNCGPGALAAITGRTLEDVRWHIPSFDAKRYTSPSMMFAALKSIGSAYRMRFEKDWPNYGLVRVQWEGPWTDPGVPMPARYRYTHWVGACARNRQNVGVFDINCINNGTGWTALKDWEDHIVPHLTRGYRRASGKWHITHALEVEP